MKKFLLLILFLLLPACQEQNQAHVSKAKTLAPLEVNKNDFDSFSLSGISYKLPLAYEDFRANGISLNEEEFSYQNLGKNSQSMANLRAADLDLGATFKNLSQEEVDIKGATIIEIYINNKNGKNQDFTINNLTWGDSYTKAQKSLKNLRTEEASSKDEKTINYYTDKSYVSLFFKDDKLESAAIFCKKYMRDESYKNGEFVVFGQNLIFPTSLSELEDLLGTKLKIEASNLVLDPMDEAEVMVYSPLFADIESELKAHSLDFLIRNDIQAPLAIKDCQIISLRSTKSPDLSVGNVYVGASIDELKIMDKNNQNPPRLAIEGKEDGYAKFSFLAGNSTSYIFYTDENIIREIEIVNIKD